VSLHRFEQDPYIQLKPGDVLITKDGTIGKLAIVEADMPERATLNSGIFVVRPLGNAYNARYLYWVLSSSVFSTFVNLTKMGSTINHLYQKELEQFAFPLPPVAIQRDIADFLGRITDTIDKLIRVKERLIEVLQEKYQALITQIVTKGLDPNVRMRDSDFPLLGKIPAHWKLKRLKHLVTEAVAGPYGSSLTKSMYVAAGYRVYGQQQVIPDDFTVGDYYISDDKFRDMKRYAVQPGDVLVSVMGTIGRVAVVPEGAEPGIINPRLVRYKPDKRLIHPRFLQASMRSDPYQVQLMLAAQGTTMEGLNMRVLGDTVIPFPDLVEQTQLLAAISRHSQCRDCVVGLVKSQLALLREYRDAVISAAITGQLNVANETAA
jgi:type I restriction enzyme S subunit